MSLTMTKFRESAKTISMALLTATFFAANANAAEPAKFVQVADLDLSKPIPSNVCVRDDAQGKAFDKIEAIKKARGQYNVIEANRVGRTDANGNAYAEIAFTSNLKASETKGWMGEGYMILSNAPKGQNGSEYCSSTNVSTGLASAINGKKVPDVVDKGDLGQALNNLMKADKKVGYVAVTGKGTLIAVNFNYKTGKGGYELADGGGNNPLPLPLVDVEYSPDLPLAYQKALGIPTDRIAAIPSSGQLMAAAPKP